MLGLIDGNNFFVSCERAFDPSLENRPVAVMSNNDGCCISRSNEFKALDIPMGTPYHELAPLIPRYGLVLMSSNYELYGDMSRRMLAILHDFSPEVEPYSIDEAYIHVNLPAAGDYGEYGRQIRQTLLQWLGIPCGVGFARSKTLAKIANHIGKRSSSGVFVMPENPEPILEQLPVGEVWGVGRRLAPRLERLGIRTARQLACADENDLRRKFNITLAVTARELRGEALIGSEDPGTLSRSISCSRSYGHPVTEFRDIAESVANYIAKAAEKLRQEKQLAAGVNLYVQYYPEYTPGPAAGGLLLDHSRIRHVDREHRADARRRAAETEGDFPPRAALQEVGNSLLRARTGIRPAAGPFRRQPGAGEGGPPLGSAGPDQPEIRPWNAVSPRRRDRTPLVHEAEYAQPGLHDELGSAA